MGGGKNIENLKAFFEPRSVVIIGTSRSPGKGGYNIIENLLRLKYSGAIYPVNPRAEKILGLKVYHDLVSLPETPELALIVLPPDRVLASFKECINRGIKAVIIESAGFGEMDASGAVVQEQLRRMARVNGVRVMGPNSVGTINPYHNFDTSLGRLDVTFLPDDDIRPGPAGFIGQTGLFTGVYLPLINAEFGISKIAWGINATSMKAICWPIWALIRLPGLSACTWKALRTGGVSWKSAGKSSRRNRSWLSSRPSPKTGPGYRSAIPVP